MITVTPCTPTDSATVAGLWNSIIAIAESCWYQAPEISAETIAAYQDAGLVFVLALNDEAAVGFGFWRPLDDVLRLAALAAETAEVYYRLMVACADWGLEHGYSKGWCEIGTRETREMGWMNALQVIVPEPIGRQPLMAGQDPALCTIERLRVTADLATLRQAALDELGG